MRIRGFKYDPDSDEAPRGDAVIGINQEWLVKHPLWWFSPRLTRWERVKRYFSNLWAAICGRRDCD